MTELFSRGWLVTLKTSPKGFLANDPWNGESDAVVDVKWWAEACYIIGRISNDTDETRKYINAHPYGSGDTAEEAMAELAKQVEELNALADAAREEDV
jgi:hypothetical protein